LRSLATLNAQEVENVNGELHELAIFNKFAEMRRQTIEPSSFGLCIWA